MVKTIIDRTPEQLKFPFYLWTREAVAQLIEKRFKIKLSIWTVGRYAERKVKNGAVFLASQRFIPDCRMAIRSNGLNNCLTKPIAYIKLH
jgi:hypothetical protein